MGKHKKVKCFKVRKVHHCDSSSSSSSCDSSSSSSDCSSSSSSDCCSSSSSSSDCCCSSSSSSSECCYPVNPLRRQCNQAYFGGVAGVVPLVATPQFALADATIFIGGASNTGYVTPFATAANGTVLGYVLNGTVFVATRSAGSADFSVALGSVPVATSPDAVTPVSFSFTGLTAGQVLAFIPNATGAASAFNYIYYPPCPIRNNVVPVLSPFPNEFPGGPLAGAAYGYRVGSAAYKNNNNLYR